MLTLLLTDFVAHIFLCYIEEEGDESICVAEQNVYPVLWVYETNNFWDCFAQEQPQANVPQTAVITLQSQSNFGLSNALLEF